MIALGLLVPVVVLGGIGALVYFLVRGRGDDAFSSRNLLRAYLRLAYMVSLVIFLVGAVNVLTAGFAGAFGRSFSYDANFYGSAPVCPQPAPAASAPPGKCVSDSGNAFSPSDTRLQDDLIRGFSLLVTGLILGAGHRFGQRAMETPAERSGSGLARAEMLIGTVGFGLVAIVALPIASYSVLHRVVLGSGPPVGSSSSDTPGAALAVAVVFLPAWLYYLFGFVRKVRASPATPPAPSLPL